MQLINTKLTNGKPGGEKVVSIHEFINIETGRLTLFPTKFIVHQKLQAIVS